MQHQGGHLPSFDRIVSVAEQILRRHGGHRDANYLVADLVGSFPSNTSIDVMVSRIRHALRNAVTNNHLQLRNQFYSLPPRPQAPLRRATPGQSPDSETTRSAQSMSSPLAATTSTMQRGTPSPPTLADTGDLQLNLRRHVPRATQSDTTNASRDRQHRLNIPDDGATTVRSPGAQPAQHPLSDRTIRKRILKVARRMLWGAPDHTLPANELASRTAADLLAVYQMTISLTRIHDVLQQPQTGRPIRFLHDHYIMDCRPWEDLTNPAFPELLPSQPTIQHTPTTDEPPAATHSSLFGDPPHRGRQISLFPRATWTQPLLRPTLSDEQ